MDINTYKKYFLSPSGGSYCLLDNGKATLSGGVIVRVLRKWYLQSFPLEHNKKSLDITRIEKAFKLPYIHVVVYLALILMEK